MSQDKDIQKNGDFWARLDKSYGSLVKAVAMLAGLIILTMVVLMLKELIMRNLGMPGEMTGEVIELLVMWCFLLPLAYSQLNGAMIRVTLLTDRLSPKNQVRFLVLSSVSAALFGILLLNASYGFFTKTAPGAYFPETGFPTIIQRAGVPLCALLLTFSGLVCTVRAIRGLRSPDKFLAGLEGVE